MRWVAIFDDNQERASVPLAIASTLAVGLSEGEEAPRV
jgi:hypothetical protein